MESQGCDQHPERKDSLEIRAQGIGKHHAGTDERLPEDDAHLPVDKLLFVVLIDEAIGVHHFHRHQLTLVSLVQQENQEEQRQAANIDGDARHSQQSDKQSMASTVALDACVLCPVTVSRD